MFAPTKEGLVYRTLFGLFWGNLAIYVVIFFITLFQCWPVEKIWIPTLPYGHCIAISGAVEIFTGAANFLSDLLMVALPLWAISRLHIALKRKLAVAALFSMGIM